jgi:hypothetical protein
MNNQESKSGSVEPSERQRAVTEEEIAALPPRAQRLVRAHLRAAGLRIVDTRTGTCADVA